MSVSWKLGLSPVAFALRSCGFIRQWNLVATPWQKCGVPWFYFFANAAPAAAFLRCPSENEAQT
jgi:hypothetical protein